MKLWNFIKSHKKSVVGIMCAFLLAICTGIGVGVSLRPEEPVEQKEIIAEGDEFEHLTPRNEGNWSDHAAASFAGGSGTEADPYLISNGAQFALLANEVNSRTLADLDSETMYPEYKYYKLTVDIDLLDYYWTPIGYDFDLQTFMALAQGEEVTPTDEIFHAFYGSIDGDGHKITGMKVEGDFLIAGLFAATLGTIDFSDGSIVIPTVVKNLGIEGSEIDVQTFMYCGGLIGGAIATEIDMCYNAIDIDVTSQVPFTENVGMENVTVFVGGIVGAVQYTSITNCYNSGSVEGNSPYEFVGAGGIAGGGQVGSISGSFNTGNISASGTQEEINNREPGTATGGIIGSASGIAVNDCYNTGDITSNCYYNADAGGIIGMSESAEVPYSEYYWEYYSENESESKEVYVMPCFVTNCYNTGVISGIRPSVENNTTGSGGIIGWAGKYGGITDCFNLGAVSGTYVEVSGIVGYVSIDRHLEISNCYYDASTANCAITYTSRGTTPSNIVLTTASVGKVSNLANYMYYERNFTGASIYTAATGSTAAKYTADGSSTQVAATWSSAWDFTNIWDMAHEINSYPTFKWYVSKFELWRKVDTSSVSFGGGNGSSEATAYEISTALQLAKLMQGVNGPNTSNYNDKFYKLTADIDLSGKLWTPIGEANFFRGTFDGNGHKITGMNLQGDFQYAGLFGGYVISTISNLGIENSKISINGLRTTAYCIGGICGSGTGTIINCYNSGSINVTCRKSCDVGGIEGGAYGASVTITNCYNTGSINVVCQNSCYIGGIKGYRYSSNTPTDCYNTGSINVKYTGSGKVYVGGIIAECNNLTNCHNRGSINVVSTNDSATCYAGGISGSGATLTNCSNAGEISVTAATKYVGGLIGRVNLSASTNYINSYNIGNITVSPAGNCMVGGLFGQVSSVQISECFASCDISAQDGPIGGILGKISNTSYTLNISKCFYEGTITTQTTSTSDSNATGGLVGYLYCKSVGSYIKDCYVKVIINAPNVQNLTSSSYIQPWIGYLHSTYKPEIISDSYYVVTVNNGYNSVNSIYNKSTHYRTYDTNGTFDGEKWYYNEKINDGDPILKANYWIANAEVQDDVKDVFNTWHTVTLNSQSATTSGTGSVGVVEGKVIPTIVVPTKTSYTFGGYFTETNGAGDLYINADGTSARKYNLTTNLTLYAYWSSSPSIITYNLNGGEVEVANRTIYDASSPTFTLNNPTKTGYTFAGWTGSNGETPETTVTITTGQSGNLTYTANFTPNTYTVTYNGNGATSGSTAASTHTYDVAKNLTANGFTKSYSVTYNQNYDGAPAANTVTVSRSFNKWTTNQDGTGDSYTNSQSVTNLLESGNLNLYAQWSDASLTIPTRTGYTFKGWFLEPECINQFGYLTTNTILNNSTYYYYAALTQDVTLYAKWGYVEIKLSGSDEVIYQNYQDGFYLDENLSVKMTSNQNPVRIPTKSGYYFDGYWITATNISTLVVTYLEQFIDANGYIMDNMSPTQLSNLIISAKFIPNPSYLSNDWKSKINANYLNNATSISFTNAIPNDYLTSVSVGSLNEGTATGVQTDYASSETANDVICYIVSNDNGYSLVFYALGKIYAPNYSYGLFANLARLTSFDYGVLSIDKATNLDEMFKNCSTLATITIPAEISKIGKNSFSGCSSLTTVTFTTPIGWYASTSTYEAVGTCVDLTTNALQALTTTYVDHYLYNPLYMLKYKEINDLIVTTDNGNYSLIDASAYTGNVLVLPEDPKLVRMEPTLNGDGIITARPIGSNITSLTINSQMKKIVAGSLGTQGKASIIGIGGSYSLESINLAVGNEYYTVYNGGLYTYNYSTLVAYPTNGPNTSIVVKSETTTIESHAFSGNKNITSIDLSNITQIGEYAFAGCNNIERIDIPVSVTKIGDYAFNLNSSGSSLANATDVPKYYTGTTSQWQTCFKTSGNIFGWNTSQTTTVIHCSDGDVTYTTGACLVEGTKITLADGSEKNIEDITYDDLLLVWNPETGDYDYEYPAWIEKKAQAGEYYKLTFDNGNELKFVWDHGIYSKTDNAFVSITRGSESVVGKEIVYLTTENGKYVNKTAKVVSVEYIKEVVNYYHVVTVRQYNLFANGILTTDGTVAFSNRFGFNDDMTWNSEIANMVKLSGTGENGYLYDYSLFEDIMPYYLFKALNVAEGRFLVEMGYLTFEEYRGYLLENVLNEDMILWPEFNWVVSTSDEFENLFDDDYEKTKVADGECFILPAPKPVEDKSFVGWKSSSDGQIYNAGESVNIYTSTHFTAIWE